MSSPARVSVEVTDLERVVPRGTTVTTWFVRRDATWIKASEWPGATTEALEAGPGTVWERAVRVEVAAGTLLMRAESGPRPNERRDPLAYLEREVRRAQRTTRRTYYRVARDGRIARVATPA